MNAGLYEPISEATMTSSNGTPICSIDAAIRSGSEFERIASRQPRFRASVTASGTSQNGLHEGSEAARPPTSPSG